MLYRRKRNGLAGGVLLQMTKYNSIFLSLMGILLSAPAFAANDAPPAIPAELFQHKAHATENIIASQFMLGAYNGIFEKTTLAEISKAAAMGEIQHQGDAGESLYWLCYTSPDHDAPQRIWIESGEMGGSKHAVLTVAAQALPAGVAATDGCPALPAAMRGLSVGHGIKLGMSRRQLTKKLGTPTKTQGEWLAYVHEKQLKDDFTETGMIAVRIANDKVVSFSASKITSN